MKKGILAIIIILFTVPVKPIWADRNIERIDSLHRLLEKRSGSERVETLLQISEAYRNISFDKTLEAGMDAIKEADRLGMAAEKARMYRSLGISAYFIGDYELAIQYFQSGFDAYEQAGDKSGMAACVHNMGTMNWELGNFPLAFEYYNQSIIFEEEIGNLVEVGTTLLQMGGLHYRQGEIDKAYDVYYRARLIFEEENDTLNIAEADFRMASCYWAWDDIDLAIETNIKALEVFIQYDYLERIAGTYNNLALIYNDNLANYEMAVKYFQHAIEIRHRLGDFLSLALSQSNLGKAYTMMGQYDLASENLYKALNVFNLHKNAEGMTLVNYYLGIYYQRKGAYEKSTAYYSVSLELADQFSIHQYRTEIIKGQLQNYAAIGDFERFMLYFDLFSASFDSTVENLRDLQQREARAINRFDEIVRESNQLLDNQSQLERMVKTYKLFLSALIALLLAGFVLYYFRKFISR